MLNELSLFRAGILQAKQHSALFDFLEQSVKGPLSYDDLLRAQLVSSVAAFDKLLHDIIRVGMTEIYAGLRPPTPKFLSEAISLEFHKQIVGASLPPPEYLFDRHVVLSLSHLAFQQPEKVADGLSRIWPEKDKWDKIGAAMNLSGKFASTKLKLIADRRNAIVHQSDIDPFTGKKATISKAEASDVSDFLERCGEAIVTLVE